jgi:hypothetical protein
MANPAQAEFIISVESVTANAGSIGNTLEVELTNTGSSTVTIGGFSFGISTATSNIDFTGAFDSTAKPYLFAGDSLFGPEIDTSNGQSLIASDFSASGLGDFVGAGATVGLGKVFFNVAPSTPGGAIEVTLTPFPTTSLSDPSGNNISVDTLNHGTITVISSVNSVPEPSTLLLALLASPAGVWMIWRQRHSSYPFTERG